jgi:uncharacterized membrane protein YphA (DoxX/SURF4 family)
MSSKAIKISFWIFNGLFAAAMLFSSVGSITSEPNTLMFIRDLLGYPEYVIPLTGWLKIIGCILILLPVRSRFKEWAYAGLCIDLFLALYSIGATMGFNADSWPMAIYVLLAAGAYYFHVKKENLNEQAI